MRNPVFFLLPFLISASTAAVHYLGGLYWLAFPGVYIVLPVLDMIFGRNKRHLDKPAFQQLNQNPVYSWLTWLMVPYSLAYYVWALFQINQMNNLWAVLGITLSMGFILGAVVIVTAHELIHRSTFFEQALGGTLLSLVCYSTFKIEHIFGHHRDVATPGDTSTAPYGQSIYLFVLRSIPRNLYKGFSLQAKRMQKQGLSPWSMKNELLWWHAISLTWASISYAIAGWLGVAFFFGQALCAIIALEMVNYVEHYGLLRSKKDNGRFERVQPIHSWNAPYRFSNGILFNLQLHSDHHAVASRPYQCLQHHNDAPELPASYPAMMILSLLPPVWRRVMDHRVPEYMRPS